MRYVDRYFLKSKPPTATQIAYLRALVKSPLFTTKERMDTEDWIGSEKANRYDCARLIAKAIDRRGNAEMQNA